MTTDAQLKDMVVEALKKMPHEMDTHQISAFLLTVLDGYVGPKVSEGVSILITSAVVYARARGVGDDRIAALLLASAYAISESNPTNSDKVH
jgi:hypothetical protein